MHHMSWIFIAVSSQNQEAFIRMINEGEAGEGGGEEGGVGGVGAALGDAPALGDALDQPGVIQVSPQDKEAIERVSPSPRFFRCLNGGAAFDKGGSFFLLKGGR